LQNNYPFSYAHQKKDVLMKKMILMGSALICIGLFFYLKSRAQQTANAPVAQAVHLPEVANVGVGNGAVYRDSDLDRLNFRTLEPGDNITIERSQDNNMVVIGTADNIRVKQNLYIPGTGSEGILIVDKDGRVSVQSFDELAKRLRS
jgi:hypothetical protein